MMLKKSTIILVLITVFRFVSYTQDYFIVKDDTTFCSMLEYETTGQGYLWSMKYKNENGKEIFIKGRKKVPNVSTFYINGISVDKTPLKANKPKKYIRYTARAVDGKLKVYLSQRGYNSSMASTPGSPGGAVGIYRFYLKMPDGKYYKINSKKNIKKYIKPYLLNCSDFKSQYKGDFNTSEEAFMETIKLYNSLCK